MMTTADTNFKKDSNSTPLSYLTLKQSKSKLSDTNKIMMPDLSTSKAKSDFSYILKFKKSTDAYPQSRQVPLEPNPSFLESIPDWNINNLKHMITQLDKKVSDTNEDFGINFMQGTDNSFLNSSTLPSSLAIHSQRGSAIPLPSSSSHSTRSPTQLSLSTYDLKLPHFFMDSSVSQNQSAHSNSFFCSMSLPGMGSFRPSHSNENVKKNTKPSTHFISDWVMSMSKTTNLKSRKQTQSSILKPLLPSNSSTSSISSASSYYTTYSSKYNPLQLMEPVKLGKLGISKDIEFEKRVEKMRKAKVYGDSIRQNHASSLPRKKIQSNSDQLLFTSAALEQRKRIQEYMQKIPKPKPKPVKLPPLHASSKPPVVSTSISNTHQLSNNNYHNALEIATQLYYQDLNVFENLKREFNV